MCWRDQWFQCQQCGPVVRSATCRCEAHSDAIVTMKKWTAEKAVNRVACVETGVALFLNSQYWSEIVSSDYYYFYL